MLPILEFAAFLFHQKLQLVEPLGIMRAQSIDQVRKRQWRWTGCSEQLADSFGDGGAALAVRRTAPLGLVLLAPSVVAIFFFDTFLAGAPLPGLLTAAIWGALALRHFAAFKGLWSYAPARA